MSRHGHRHSRISRIINAKHRQEQEDSEAGNSDDTDHSPDSDETLSTLDPCDPLQSTTCPDDTSEESLIKRQADTDDEADAITIVQTVLQITDPSSQTLWQSSGVDFPMTISASAFGELTISEGSATTSSLLATSPADLPTTSITSSATQYTGTSKQRGPVSSPRVSPATSSQPQPHTSTPLVSFASTTRAPTTAPITTSIYVPSSSSSSTSYYWSETSQSPSSSSDIYGGPEQTGTTSGSGSGSGSSTSTGSSGSGPAIDPTTSKIVGGVVGSVAGLAFILVFVLYALRRRGYLQRFFKGRGTETLPSSDARAGAGAAGTREISERERPSSVLTASYFAPAFMKRWRQSTMTTRTESTIDSSSSERGFQKISGRKIAPVLTHGGDGYGGRLDGDSPTIPDCLIGLSPQSPTGGPLSSPSFHGPPPASPFGSPLDTNYTREADENSSPARPSKVQLPVSSSVHSGIPTTVNPAQPIPQPQSAVPVQRPDSLGRSLPSFDGSRGSRFTESLDL
ncbi:hypothetical protein N7478_009852 [Penicillium angulare]|uniref:uncharacterized protein n=1 Tax=Penicillium angulare TaxID=116970 RepID=UPI002540FCA1|nr:uncharacterized protein N7478_009852 [Penicillium angulare]KAJ5267044.1 hypothetical protein N7478_009852 [Penicillium angulare]